MVLAVKDDGMTSVDRQSFTFILKWSPEYVTVNKKRWNDEKMPSGRLFFWMELVEVDLLYVPEPDRTTTLSEQIKWNWVSTGQRDSGSQELLV